MSCVYCTPANPEDRLYFNDERARSTLVQKKYLEQRPDDRSRRPWPHDRLDLVRHELFATWVRRYFLMMNDTEARESPEDREQDERERWETLRQLEEWLEPPVILLGIVWLVLLVVELIWGLPPFLETIGIVIWAIFVVDVAVRFILAPKKLTFLKQNILTLISLALPPIRFLRVFRMVRVLRVARGARGGVRLVRVIGSLNRGMTALRNTMRRRGFGYVLLLTIIVTLVGAAGIFALEQEDSAAQGFETYGDALWWTGMIMTTLGSTFWPVTSEGRVLAFLLSLYAAGVFGYLTAFIASFLIDREAHHKESSVADAESLEEIKREIALLRSAIERISDERGRE
ncbi:MAG: ion transporter [Spirochaetota bacterium]